MVKYIKGNILDSKADYLCFTVNSVIKNNGSLVMGAGVANAFRDKFKDIDKIFGREILHLSEFNLLQIRSVIALQTKVHFKDKSDINLVSRTIDKLGEFALMNKDKTIAITYVGTGCGGLDKDLVKSRLDLLPNNIEIWEI